MTKRKELTESRKWDLAIRHLNNRNKAQEDEISAAALVPWEVASFDNGTVVLTLTCDDVARTVNRIAYTNLKNEAAELVLTPLDGAPTAYILNPNANSSTNIPPNRRPSTDGLEITMFWPPR